MPRSFKLKLALYSVALFGILLTGYCVYFLRMSFRIGLERTDTELRSTLGGQIRRHWQGSHLERIEEGLKSGPRERPGGEIVYLITDHDGKVLLASEVWPEGYDGEKILGKSMDSVEFAERTDPPPESAPGSFRRGQPRSLPASRPEFETEGNYRMMALCNPEVRALVGMGLAPLKADIGRFRTNLLLSAPLALLLLIAGGWLLAQLALRPVNTIVHTARKVTALNLGERISVAKADYEFQELIDTINDMLQRLERSFRQAARFSADAAHELKTPLTILQAELESAMGKSVDDSDDQQNYMEFLDEVQRLDSIIRNLLILSQADSGRLPLNREPVDLSAMIDDAVEDIGALDPQQKTDAEIEPGVQVDADRRLLELVLHNLVGNAVKYSLGEPPIGVSLERGEEWVNFAISNRGSVIPVSERERVFERFYRADKSRSRKVEGTGLGLSLAREIAHAHGGMLELLDGGEGVTTFKLSLPAQVTER